MDKPGRSHVYHHTRTGTVNKATPRSRGESCCHKFVTALGTHPSLVRMERRGAIEFVERHETGMDELSGSALVTDQHDGTRGMVGHIVADRAAYESGQPFLACGTDHEHVCVNFVGNSDDSSTRLFIVWD